MNNKAIYDLLITISELDAPSVSDTMEAWLARAVENEFITSKQRFDINWIFARDEMAAKVVAKVEAELLAM